MKSLSISVILAFVGCNDRPLPLGGDEATTPGNALMDESDAEYLAEGVAGDQGQLEFVVLKRVPSRDLCFGMTIDEGVDDSFGPISAPGYWGVRNAFVSNRADPCEFEVSTMGEETAYARSGQGKLSWDNSGPRHVPCAVSFDVTFFLDQTAAWVPASERFIVKSLAVRRCQ